MAANTVQIFPLTPNVVQARLTTIGNFSGTNTSNLITGGANGTLLYRIRAYGDSSTTPFIIRFFFSIGGTVRNWLAAGSSANGTGQGSPNFRPTTTAEVVWEFSNFPTVIPANVILQVNLSSLGSCTNVDVTAEGQDY